MTDAELKQLTLTSSAALIRRKAISPVELTRSVLDRTDRLRDMNVYITVAADQAVEQALAAERAVSDYAVAGSLAGVPISLKDLFDTKGIRTTAGSKVMEGRVPDEDALVVKRLADHGSVLIGKTNMHEFAFGTTTINPHYGTARNPWDPERIVGGSSGGSASSIALSLAFGSLGTDTGGSIRIPAALCGIVGLKPTYGLVSLRGVLPLSWSLDHAGPMTQTVEDAALMLGLIAGHDPDDPFSRNVPVPSYTARLEDGVRGIRIGIPRTYFFERVAPEVEAACRQAIHTLEKLGARSVDVDLPSARLQRAIFMHIVSPEAWSFHEPYLRDHGDLYGADVRDRIETGRLLLSVDYVRAQRARGLMKAECKAMFRDADVVVTPTVPIPPPRIDERTVSWGSDTETVYSALTRFTRPFNLVGLPAVSIPCGFTSNGLPIGLQIAGKPFDEPTILRVAHAYERDSRWSERRPGI